MHRRAIQVDDGDGDLGRFAERSLLMREVDCGITQRRLLLERSNVLCGREHVESREPHVEREVRFVRRHFGARHFGWRAIHAVRDGTWKYIDAPAPELYDVRADPAERDNRHAQRAATAPQA